jgi:hypothetical protein
MALCFCLQREDEAWTNMNVVVFHGNSSARACILEHEFYYADKSSGVRQYDKPVNVLYKFNVSACAVVCMWQRGAETTCSRLL